MKKSVIGVALIGICLVAGAAFGWDIPKSAQGVKDVGGKVALQTALNKKIEGNKCAFKGGTADTTCDLNKLGKELAAAYRGAGEVANYNVYINVEADEAVPQGKGKKATASLSGSERADKVSEKLRGNLASAALTDSWHYNTRATGAKGNNLKISVEVK